MDETKGSTIFYFFGVPHVNILRALRCALWDTTPSFLPGYRIAWGGQAASGDRCDRCLI